jgi:hypothetical protein
VTRDQAGKLIAVMLAAVPSHRVDAKSVPDMIAAYADLLGDLSYELCNAALRSLLQTRTWLPSVADIRATAIELKHGPVRTGGEAWGAVLQAMKSEGAYRFPGIDFRFTDRVTASCVASLGWKELCLSENQVSDRARFIELYDGLATQDSRESRSPVLAAARDRRDHQKSLRDPLNKIINHLRLVPKDDPEPPTLTDGEDS